MRLAVDAQNVLTDCQGIGRYVRTLLRLFLADPHVEATLMVRAVVPLVTRHRIAALLERGRFATASAVPRAADVVWHPWNGTFFESERPSVATVHDAVPFAFPSADPVRRAREQEPFLRTARTARLIIAVSQAGAREISARLGVPEERVRVIYHGVAPIFSPAPAKGASARGAGYLLFVGNPMQELKNFALLHRAYRRAWEAGRGPELVVVGGAADGFEGARCVPAIRGGGASRDADGRMSELYRGALALCIPSHFESFGMPMLEAMACGTPVLAAATGALPEISGGAALLLDADDEELWAEALRSVAGDGALRARLRAAGIERARSFSWERCAAQTLAVLEEAAR